MNPERYRTVTEHFQAKELAGPFELDFEVGDCLVFLRYDGEDNTAVVFALERDVLKCNESDPYPKPQYEVSRELFEASTCH